MNDGYPRRHADSHNRRPRSSSIGSRPDRVALWAVFMALAAMLAAAASSHAASGGSGGVGDPSAKSPEGPKSPDAKSPECDDDVRFGERALSLGDCGSDVKTLNWILNSKSFGATAPLGEEFEDATARSVRRYQSKAEIEPSGVVDDETRSVLVGSMRKDIATWYGPGFYGNETACGQQLNRRTVGVAHKSLPCGSKVTLEYRGRFLHTRVIDRGPYTHGAKWDLTNGAAQKLGFETTSTVRSAIVR